MYLLLMVSNEVEEHFFRVHQYPLARHSLVIRQAIERYGGIDFESAVVLDAVSAEQFGVLLDFLYMGYVQ